MVEVMLLALLVLQNKINDLCFLLAVERLPRGICTWNLC